MNKNKICINILMFAMIISSYIGLLCFISNEGLKNQTELPRHSAIDVEMMAHSMQLQDANFREIKINKNLINVE